MGLSNKKYRSILFALSATVASFTSPIAKADNAYYSISEIPYGSIDINNHGVITGSTGFPGYTQLRAFKYENGLLTNLGSVNPSEVGNGIYSQGFSINDSGTIVGISRYGAQNRDAGFFYLNGQMRAVPASIASYEYVFSVNESNVACGIVSTGSGTYNLPALFDGRQSVPTVTIIGGGVQGTAAQINNLGKVVGAYKQGALYRAFIFDSLNSQSTSLIDLNTFRTTNLVNQNCTLRVASSINDQGLISVSGYCSPANGPFSYKAWLMRPYGSGYTFSEIILPNNQIIQSNGQLNYRGILVGGDLNKWINVNGVSIDANSLIPANSGWQISNLIRINDVGQIIGNGTKNGVSNKYFVMNPNTFGIYCTGSKALNYLLFGSALCGLDLAVSSKMLTISPTQSLP